MDYNKLYEDHIAELRAQLNTSTDENHELAKKVRHLENIVQMAKVANTDLHDAYDYMRHLNASQIQPDSQPLTEVEEEVEEANGRYLNLAMNSIGWVSEREKMMKKTRFLERECERYQRDNATLGKQVRCLLSTLERERGMIIRKNNEIKRDPTSALDVIDDRLVTFESIEQLQQQNQKLLSLVKELTKREEECDLKMESEDIRRLNADIDALKNELNTVKEEREKIANNFETILKERDLFKILVSKTRGVTTPEIFQRMVTVACASGPALAIEASADKSSHIADLKDMVTKLQNEISACRDKYDADRSHFEEELTLKTQLLEKSYQEAAFAKKTVTTLEQNIETLTNDFEAIRAKAQKLGFQLEELPVVKENNAKLQSEVKELQAKTYKFLSQLEQLEALKNENKAYIEDLIKEKLSKQEAVEEMKQLRNIERTDKLRLVRKNKKLMVRLKKRKALLKQRNRGDIVPLNRESKKRKLEQIEPILESPRVQSIPIQPQSQPKPASPVMFGQISEPQSTETKLPAPVINQPQQEIPQQQTNPGGPRITLKRRKI